MPRILVIDDDDAVRNTILALLAHARYEAVGADGGATGLKALTAGGFDAVLLDIFMPGMDGIETMRTFREHAPHVPIVAMSGFMVRDESGEAPDFLGLATKLGAAYRLQKPFRPKELYTVVEACLSDRASHDGEAGTRRDPAA
jgi:CheY-like chemotaxis protein